MGKGVTVIFGTIRTTPTGPRMRGLSGPPPGGRAAFCAVEAASGRGRRDKQKKELEPDSEETSKGRDFTRRVRTFFH